MRKITIEVHSNGYTLTVEYSHSGASSSVFTQDEHEKLLSVVRHATKIYGGDDSVLCPNTDEDILSNLRKHHERSQALPP